MIASIELVYLLGGTNDWIDKLPGWKLTVVADSNSIGIQNQKF